MKKTFRLIFSVLLGVCCLIQTGNAASISDSYLESSVRKATILSSYNLDEEDGDTVCTHSHTRIDIRDVISETCTDTTYNYTMWCYDCGKYVTGGIMVMPKETPEHVMRWYTVSCKNGIHTYERRCVKCGYATESFSQACSGPPCPEIMSLAQFLW